MSASSYKEFVFLGRGGIISVCDVAIAAWGERATVIMRDRDDNPGTSVTNFVEGIATKLWRQGLCEMQDAGLIAWYSTHTDHVYTRITFGIVPANKSGYFALPEWQPVQNVMAQLSEI